MLYLDEEPTAVWIVDTSPFVGLAKIGRLNLLTAPTRQVWIADIVEQEVLAGRNADLAQDALQQEWDIHAQLGFVRVAAPFLPPTLAALSLDAGEAAVLALALNRPGSIVIMDDSEGRAAAHTLGVSVVGTVGILLQAKKEGRLERIAPVLRDLQTVGLFLPREGFLAALMTSVGETWP